MSKFVRIFFLFLGTTAWTESLWDKSNVHISNPPNTLTENWMHLLVDGGAVDRGSRVASAGGVLLDQNRNWTWKMQRLWDSTLKCFGWHDYGRLVMILIELWFTLIIWK